MIWKIIIEKNMLTVDTNIGEMEPSTLLRYIYINFKYNNKNVIYKFLL